MPRMAPATDLLGAAGGAAEAGNERLNDMQLCPVPALCPMHPLPEAVTRWDAV